MVYCGKPSTSCQACRERKTRCDRETPSCTQCIRAQRPCPGYRSQLDLMFRNESDIVIGKVKAKEKSRNTKATKSSTPSNGSTTLHTSSKSNGCDILSTRTVIPVRTTQQIPGSISDGNPPKLQRKVKTSMTTPTTPDLGNISTPSYAITPSLCERSAAYFSTHSAIYLRNFDLLSSLSPHSTTSPHLLACIHAVGAAGLSNSLQAPYLMALAQKHYIMALSLTNLALRSPTDVKKDSTLFSVLILGIFETIAGKDMKSIAAWTKHIHGAAALVKLRGPEQFMTEGGRRMYLQVFSSLMISCIQRGIAFPRDIVDLRSEAAKYMDTSSPQWEHSGVIADFTVFRAELREGKVTDPRAVVERAKDLDRRLQETHRNLPGELRYETIVDTQRPEVVWDGYYHQYDNYWTAQVWNGMRVCRIILHECMLGQFNRVDRGLVFTDAEIARESAGCITVLLEMQAGILASVSMHFAGRGRGARGSKEEMGLLYTGMGYFLLWPLYVVGIMEVTGEELRAWVVRRLEDLGDMGVGQARVLAGYVKTRREVPERES